MFETHTDLIASDLMTEEVVGIEASACVDIGRRWLDERGFDVAPVIEEGEYQNNGPGVIGGTTIGYVELSTLVEMDHDSERSVSQVATDITMDCLVDSQAAFDEMLNALFDRHWYFIGSRTGISGILTRADLNKPPVSAYFYLLIYELETRLRDLIEELDIDWETILKDDTDTPNDYSYETYLDEVEDYYERSVADDLELRKLEYTSLTHLREIVRNNEAIQSVLPIDANQIHEIKELRNDVAHPRPKNIITVTDDPAPISRTPEGHRGMEDLADTHYDLTRALEQLRAGV